MTQSSERRRGQFITFEGGDGAGKSTQVGRVRAWLHAQGRAVLATREPGASKLGEQLRRLILHGPEELDARTEALLYAADRAHHVARTVRPALRRGTTVLCDRYVDSTLAYQGAARDLGVRDVRRLSMWATDGLVPDLTFLLDLPPEVGLRRLGGRLDQLERQSAAFHEAVRREYLDLANAEPERFVVIDAVGTPDQVFREILGALRERLCAGGAARAAGEGVVGA